MAAARSARPRCGDVVVVAIDGTSGAGKTTLAEAVASGLACPVVHMDDLYPGWDGLAAGIELLTRRILAPLATGRPAHFPVWDWQQNSWGPERVLEPMPMLVVEGCGSSVHPAGAYAALRVWLDAPRAVRLARGLARDGETYRPHWERWAAQEDAIFARDDTRGRAHLAIET
ncbi:MAG: hypothetical protein ACLGHZ_03865 [Actinomycetes bacterium]